MTSPFTGEIQIFGFNFPPIGWAFANGATIAIQQNTFLFALIGTTYGGNGTTTFQLPNLVGRGPGGQGSGPGLTPRVIGETYGEFNVALINATMPPHLHTMVASNPPAGVTPVATATAGAALARFGGTDALVPNNPTPNATLAPAAVVVTGGSIPHPNQQPYLTVNFCIALNGVPPSFS
jgi:microcystin-dependent protein